jgi:hypothetical protein
MDFLSIIRRVVCSFKIQGFGDLDSLCPLIKTYLKSIIFWDMTPCSLLSCKRRFGETYRLHLQGWRNNSARSRWQAFLQVVAELFLQPWRWRRYVPPKRRLQLNRLHGVISQKMILFITTAVRTSSPTKTYLIGPNQYTYGFGYDGQNLAVNNCEFLETLRHLEGFPVWKLFKTTSSGKNYSPTFLDTKRATLKTTPPTIFPLLRVYSLPR